MNVTVHQAGEEEDVMKNASKGCMDLNVNKSAYVRMMLNAITSAEHALAQPGGGAHSVTNPARMVTTELNVRTLAAAETEQLVTTSLEIVLVPLGGLEIIALNVVTNYLGEKTAPINVTVQMVQSVIM